MSVKNRHACLQKTENRSERPFSYLWTFFSNCAHTMCRIMMSKYVIVLLLVMQYVPSQAMWMMGQGTRGGHGGREGGQQQQQQQQQSTMMGDTTDTDLDFNSDHTVIQQLVEHRHKIERTVKFTDNGVATRTWSDDNTVASWIEQHVAAMQARLKTGNRIRQGDPLFRAVFDHAAEFHNDLVLNFTVADGGVYVTETSSTRCGIDLIQAHADVVSGFIDKGPAEVCLNHDVPRTCAY